MPNTDYENLLAEIKTTLQGVTDIGAVYDYERYAADWNTFFSYLTTSIGGTDQIRGWMILSPTMTQTRSAMGKNNERTIEFVIRGYFELDDTNSGGKTARALVETVCNTLDANTDLNGAALDSAPSQILRFEQRTFDTTVCHYAEIKLTPKVSKDF